MSQSTGEQLTISGGTIVVNADGDGLDSNGDLHMTGGTVTVNGPENGGNGALDTAGELSITGGTLAALGSAGMAESPTSGQGWVQANVTANAGDTIEVKDAQGSVIATLTATKTVGNVVYSSPDITTGDMYTVGDQEVTAGTATGGGMGGPGSMGGPGAAPAGDQVMPGAPGAVGGTQSEERGRRGGRGGTGSTGSTGGAGGTGDVPGDDNARTA